MENKQNAILHGDLRKTIIKLSIPVIIANFIQQLYNLADVYFVGKLGGTQLAAITFSWPLVLLILAIGSGISVAGVSMISQSIGREDLEGAKENAEQLLILAICLGSVIAILGFLFSHKLLEVLGVDGLLLRESSSYIKWILLATPATFIAGSHSSIRRAEGNTIRPMIINIISVIANVILNPLLIFGLGLGVTGAGIATAIARFGVASYCIYELLTLDSPVRLNINDFKVHYDKLKNLVKIGIPVSISQGTTSLGFIILNIYVKDYGDNVLAAYGLGNRVHSLFFLLAQGIGVTIAAIIGQNYGARNYKRLRMAMVLGLKFSVIASTLGAIVNQIFARQLAELFSSNEEVVYHAINYMRLVSTTVIAWGVFQIHNGFFQGIGKTKELLMINLTRLWILRIPLVIILTKTTNLGEYSVWYAMFWSNVVTALVSTMIYLYYSKKFYYQDGIEL